MPRLAPNSKLLILSLISALNVLLGIYLSRHFYEIRSGTGAMHSICDVNAWINCDDAAGSKYAELVAGIPLSAFVSGWCLGILCLSLLARRAAWSGGAAFVIAAMTAVSAGMSVFYTLVMFVAIKSVCVFCLSITAVDFTSFAIALSLKPVKEQSAGWQRSVAIALLCAFLVPPALHALLSIPASVSAAQFDEEVKKLLASPVLTVKPGGPSLGPENAPITIVEFSDLQCPFCKRGAQVMHGLLSRYAGKIHLVFKHYPLDPQCNQGMKQAMHPFACEAARAVYCAGEQGKFWEAYENIFDKQEALAPGAAARFAAEAGANPAKLADCITAFPTNLRILGDIDEAEQLGIQQSAPVFFVNGHKLAGAYPMPFWDRLFEELLK